MYVCMQVCAYYLLGMLALSYLRVREYEFACVCVCVCLHVQIFVESYYVRSVNGSLKRGERTSKFHHSFSFAWIAAILTIVDNPCDHYKCKTIRTAFISLFLFFIFFLFFQLFLLLFQIESFERYQYLETIKMIKYAKRTFSFKKLLLWPTIKRKHFAFHIK